MKLSERVAVFFAAVADPVAAVAGAAVVAAIAIVIVAVAVVFGDCVQILSSLCFICSLELVGSELWCCQRDLSAASPLNCE